MPRKPRRCNYPPPCATQEAWACCGSPYGVRQYSILRRLGATVIGRNEASMASPHRSLEAPVPCGNQAARLSSMFSRNIRSWGLLSAALWLNVVLCWLAHNAGADAGSATILCLLQCGEIFVPILKKLAAWTLARARLGLELVLEQQSWNVARSGS